MLNVSIVGEVRISDQDGCDRTPKGKKTRALIALLILSPNHRRTRAWIQDKLWSDRGAEQGAGSLRQTLTELRRVLGPHREVLIAEGGLIQLDPEKVQLSDKLTELTDDQEICEDLGGIADPEFEDWLRGQRQQVTASFSAPQQRSKTPLLVIGADWPKDGRGAAIHQLIRDDVVRALLEFCEVRIVDLGAGRAETISGAGPGVFLRISGAEYRDEFSVSLRVEALSGNWIIWQSPNGLIPECYSTDDAWRMRALVQCCLFKINDEFERQASEITSGVFAQALANRAMRLLFQFRRQDLADADLLLKSAYELEPRGVYLSWRAFIRNTAVFEHLTDDFLEPCEGYELHATALGDDPLNSYTLVFAGQHCFVNDGDPIFGQELCDRALSINPGNPMGWAFRSNMLILQGEVEQATQAAERGLILAGGQPCRSSLQINSCLSAISAERYREAMSFGRMSQMSQSRSQAVRRFMFALSKSLDMPIEADRQFAAIRGREPNFQPSDLLLQSYPTWTLQKTRISEALQ